jgi:REP element-mobilizing transposase RayT
MARPLRIEYPGAVYHVTSRGNARNRIFSDDQDRETFLSILGTVGKRYNWLLHAYCLMPNHYHCMIETPDGNLSVGMRQLNGIYTQKYNRRHNKTGHIFQGRFKAILVQKENYLLELCRYVVLNPVRARLVEKPEAWRWSSYGATAGLRKKLHFLTTDWILSVFDRKTALAQKRYRAFVRERMHNPSPWDEVRGQVLLGEEGFAERFKDFLEDKKILKEIPRSQRFVNRPNLHKIFDENETKIQRDVSIGVAHLNHGYTLKEIADYLHLHYTTVSKVISKGGDKNF